MIPEALQALVESLRRPEGSCFFVLGPARSGKSLVLASLQGALAPAPGGGGPASGAHWPAPGGEARASGAHGSAPGEGARGFGASSPAPAGGRRGSRRASPALAAAEMTHWIRREMAERPLAACRVSLVDWADMRALPLQAVLSAEVTRQLPGLGLAFSSEHLARGGLGEALAERGLDGVVLLLDDLDRFEAPREGDRLEEDLVFLDELAGQVAVYQLPLWVVFTLRREIPGTRTMGGRAGRALRDRYTALRLQRERG